MRASGWVDNNRVVSDVLPLCRIAACRVPRAQQRAGPPAAGRSQRRRQHADAHQLHGPGRRCDASLGAAHGQRQRQVCIRCRRVSLATWMGRKSRECTVGAKLATCVCEPAREAADLRRFCCVWAHLLSDLCPLHLVCGAQHLRVTNFNRYEPHLAAMRPLRLH